MPLLPPQPEEPTRSRPAGAGPASGEGQTFLRNEIVAGRYRVVRFLARGGMGELYEVEDLELGDRVALKTLRSGALDDAEAAEQFRRETSLARRITHPAVCRIFDVGFHAPASGARRIAFLTMELVRGETLAARLQREGPLSAETTLAMARQMAEAIDAAHAIGVVHCDLKPANVLLAGDRVVVSDFGIARATHESRRANHGGDGFAGTPAYAAPEQWTHGAVGPAADIYAFGVVLAEMRTGVRPSAAGESQGLGRRWRAVLRRCLDPDPGRRFATAGAAVAALRPGWRPMLAGALVPAIALGFVAWTALRGPREARVAGRPDATRPAIAVLGVRTDDSGGLPDWLGAGLRELLAVELAAGGQLRLIPAADVSRASAELGVSLVAVADDAAVRLASLVGADLALVGTLTALAGGEPAQVELELRLLAAGQPRERARVRSGPTPSDPREVAARAVAPLRASLGVAPAAEHDAQAARRALTVPAEALRQYLAGVERLRRFEYLAARDELERAIAVEPVFALARSALSEALVELGDQSRARTEAERAWLDSAGLAREEQLRIQARHHAAREEWSQAVDVRRRLWGFFPDSPEHGLALIESLFQVHAYDEARQVARVLASLPGPAGRDPRIDYLVAQTYLALDYGEMRAGHARAARKAKAIGARLLYARARRGEGVAAAWMGDLTGATLAHREALAICRELGDLSCAVSAARNVAILLQRDASGRDAAELLADAERMAARHGSPLQRHTTMTYRATAELARGNHAEADAAIRRLAAIGNPDAPAQVVQATMLRGELAIARGRLEEAQRELEAALATYRSIGYTGNVAATLASLGLLLWERGDDAGASRRLAEADRILSRTGGGRNGLLRARARTQAAGDPGRAAGEELACLARLAVEADASGRLDQARRAIALARLAISRGDSGTALAEAEGAVRRLAAADLAPDELEAWTVLAEALALAPGGDPEALRLLAAVAATAEGWLPGIALEAAVALGRSLGRAGDAAGCRAELSRAGGRAADLGFVRIAREARSAERSCSVTRPPGRVPSPAERE